MPLLYGPGGGAAPQAQPRLENCQCQWQLKGHYYTARDSSCRQAQYSCALPVHWPGQRAACHWQCADPLAGVFPAHSESLSIDHWQLSLRLRLDCVR